MYGALLGSMMGSGTLLQPGKAAERPQLSMGGGMTDGAVMTVAAGWALIRSFQAPDSTDHPFRGVLIDAMQKMGGRYPQPVGGYSG